MQSLAQSLISTQGKQQLNCLFFSPLICSSCTFLSSTLIVPFQKKRWTRGTCRCTLV